MEETPIWYRRCCKLINITSLKRNLDCQIWSSRAITIGTSTRKSLANVIDLPKALNMNATWSLLQLWKTIDRTPAIDQLRWKPCVYHCGVCVFPGCLGRALITFSIIQLIGGKWSCGWWEMFFIHLIQLGSSRLMSFWITTLQWESWKRYNSIESSCRVLFSVRIVLVAIQCVA